MTRTLSHSVIQGYFPQGMPAQLSQRQPSTVQPSIPGRSHQPLSYQEITIQAHLRSSGLAGAQKGTEKVFALPPHMASFGRRPGQKLPSAIQQKMESVFGADFSDVQVHVGPEASSIGALAFTRGADIHFAPGQYNPNSHFGQKLLAHELTHVLQQRAGRVRSPFTSGVTVIQDPVLEAEAERMGTKAAMEPATSLRLPTVPVQRSASMYTRKPFSRPRTFLAKLAPRFTVPLHTVPPGRAPRSPWGRLRSLAPIQRMEVEEEAPTQAVEVEKSGEEVPKNKLAAIKAIVQAAIDADGKENENADLRILERILAEKDVKDAMPANSEGTFAIGKAGKTVISTGSGEFEAAVEDNTPIAYLPIKKLGARDSFVHGESNILQDSPAATAVAATQDCCLFCFGYLASKGIGHQKLRASPFPKGWIHPQGTLKLKQVNPNIAPKGALVWITYGTKTCHYRVN